MTKLAQIKSPAVKRSMRSGNCTYVAVDNNAGRTADYAEKQISLKLRFRISRLRFQVVSQVRIKGTNVATSRGC